jgi:hypothetical protein
MSLAPNATFLTSAPGNEGLLVHAGVLRECPWGEAKKIYAEYLKNL